MHALESMKLNINKIIPIVGTHISFLINLNILSQWGQISLNCKSIQKQAVGTYTVAFSKDYRVMIMEFWYFTIK
jgi:hypothetical protein